MNNVTETCRKGVLRRYIRLTVLNECGGKGGQHKGGEESRPWSQNQITSVTAVPRGEGRLSQLYHATGIITFGKEYQLI